MDKNNDSGNTFPVPTLDINLEPSVDKNRKNNNNSDLSFDLSFDSIESRNYFKKIKEGYRVQVDYTIPVDCKPDWYDEDKFKAGQKFAQSHAFGISFAEMISLYLIFACKGALEPLIFSNKSHTPFLAFKRYLSTNLRVRSWYEEDPWELNSKARANILTVRGMHKQVEKQLNRTDPIEVRKKVTLTNKENVALWCPMRDKYIGDFQTSLSPSSCPFSNSGAVWMSQGDMAITQSSFVGLYVTYPDKFGCGHVTDEELESFIHLWRVIGYMLGTKDDYNFCNGSLSEVRSRTKDYCEYMFKPSLRKIDGDWEHMCRCLTEGIGYYVKGADFDVSLLYLFYVLNIEAPVLRSSLSYGQLFMYYTLKLLFKWLITFRQVSDHLNWVLNKAVSEAESFSKHQLNTLQNRRYTYTEQSDKT